VSAAQDGSKTRARDFAIGIMVVFGALLCVPAVGGDCKVRKTPLLGAISIQKRLSYQDRLGTNIGNVQKQGVFCRLGPTHPRTTRVRLLGNEGVGSHLSLRRCWMSLLQAEVRTIELPHEAYIHCGVSKRLPLKTADFTKTRLGERGRKGNQ
jgi:hypothetical protein